ncbi:type II toxin-antitoxin system PemK/MazF family toxin [Kytococcus sedentarius]|nr:type II toxin-antitoxin system PemK/MazF family toxin [Kytococcus sedentarius]
MTTSTRPVLVLTREPARAPMTKVTVAPITTTVKGLSSELPVGPANGLDGESAASLDNVLTVPVGSLRRVLGWLHPRQERDLAVAIVRAYDLDLPLLS